MAITRIYSCNLCRDKKETTALIGLHWNDWPKGWEEKPPSHTENHICKSCLSNLQAMKQLCGQGFECSGGAKCGSDHK
jgi:hypothetical protein